MTASEVVASPPAIAEESVMIFAFVGIDQNDGVVDATTMTANCPDASVLPLGSAVCVEAFCIFHPETSTGEGEPLYNSIHWLDGLVPCAESTLTNTSLTTT